MTIFIILFILMKYVFIQIINFQIHITRKLLIFDGQYINEICVEIKFIHLL